MARTAVLLRRVLRGTVWAVKGLLAVVAVGALFAWPWSYGHAGWVGLSRYTVGATHEWSRWYGDWQTGRLKVGRTVRGFSAESAATRPRDAWAALLENAEGGPGWHWTVHRHGLWSYRVGQADGPSTWIPVRWAAGDTEGFSHRELDFPCWLLALAAGAWPAGSVALLVRRRRRLRRLARVGCCRRCGYDLRATPEPAGAGGGLLAVCPECGEKACDQG